VLATWDTYDDLRFLVGWVYAEAESQSELIGGVAHERHSLILVLPTTKGTFFSLSNTKGTLALQVPNSAHFTCMALESPRTCIVRACSTHRFYRSVRRASAPRLAVALFQYRLLTARNNAVCPGHARMS